MRALSTLVGILWVLGTCTRIIESRHRKSYQMHNFDVRVTKEHPNTLRSQGRAKESRSSTYRQPPETDVHSGDRKLRSQPPPRFMTRLYDKAVRDGVVSNGLDVGNTARAIPPSIAKVENRDLLAFNLSCLSRDERLFGAELHIFRRRRRAQTMTVTAYSVHARALHKSITWTLNPDRVGWQVLDLYRFVRRMIKLPNVSALGDQLILALDISRNSDSTISPYKMISRARKGLPFIVLYSNDSHTNITVDHLEPHYKPTEDEWDNKGLPVAQKQSNFVPANHALNRRRRSPGRHSQSLITNEVISDPSAYINVPWKTGVVRAPLKPSTGGFEVRFQPREEDRTSVENEVSEEDDETNEVITANKKRKQRKGRRRNDEEKIKSPRKPLFSDWLIDEVEQKKQEYLIDRANQIRICSLRQLTVNFADIGWGEWVIAPKFYETNYCDGSCQFPIAKIQKPSNHATIQSIVSAVNIPRPVPMPCCSPRRTSALPMLYHDQNGVIVLKIYPDMTVEECGCQ